MHLHVLYLLHITLQKRITQSTVNLQGGKGYADMLFVPRSKVNKPAIVVELKWNKDADTAIGQIKERQYVESLKGYSCEVVLVGMNYAAGKDGAGKFKKYECRIDKVKL